jgi:nicotinate-nucleotide adenylyltransferase
MIDMLIKNKIPITCLGARIGILSGSFDPPHLGHKLLAIVAMKTKKLDQVLIIPCAAHPNGKQLSKFEDRITMCELTFLEFKNISISRIEEKLPFPNYTFQTLELIYKSYPQKKIFFIAGSDLFDDINKWKNIDKIKQLATLVFFNRENVYQQAKSRLIREKIYSQNLRHLDPKVANYITKNNIYS